MDYNKITVSQHARERYIERMEKLEGVEALKTLKRDEDYINRQIIIMVEKGVELYAGPTERNELAILIRNGTWLILLDAMASRVITLYAVDLGLGEEFNMNYLDQMTKKLKEAVVDSGRKKELLQQITDTNKMIESAESAAGKLEKDIVKAEQNLKRFKSELKEHTNMITRQRRNIIKYKNELSLIHDESQGLVNTLLQRQVF